MLTNFIYLSYNLCNTKNHPKSLTFGVKRADNFKMNEDFFCKIRNGHPLADTFDKSTNTLDIRSNGLFPSNVLSNLAKKPFVIDGVECASIEGFLQSLKIQDEKQQKEICALYGGSAKKQSKHHNGWQKTQTLYWQGVEYKRDSDEYLELIEKAYRACLDKNIIFRQALESTKGMKLTHTKGNNDKEKTILTTDEFISILTKIRDEDKN